MKILPFSGQHQINTKVWTNELMLFASYVCKELPEIHPGNISKKI